MIGTSRSGWAAIHIAAERLGIERPTCGDGIEIEFREIPGISVPEVGAGVWRVSFIGTNPGQRLRYVKAEALHPSVSVTQETVTGKDVAERLAIHPEKVAPALAQVRRMSKAFGPDGRR